MTQLFKIYEARGIGDSEVNARSRYFSISYSTWTKRHGEEHISKAGNTSLLSLHTWPGSWPRWLRRESGALWIFNAYENGFAHFMSPRNVKFLRFKIWQGCWTPKTHVYMYFDRSEQSILRQAEWQGRHLSSFSRSSFYQTQTTTQSWPLILIILKTLYNFTTNPCLVLVTWVMIDIFQKKLLTYSIKSHIIPNFRIFIFILERFRFP